MATNLAAHAEGGGTTASGQLSHAEGNLTTASGIASHAEGTGTTASGVAAHAEGSGAAASGNAAHAEGTATIASALNAHAEGSATVAGAQNSHAEGNLSLALRHGQSAHSSGPGALVGVNFAGETQHSRCTLAGQTAGLAVGESVDLLLGASPGASFDLAADRAYTFVITVVMQGQIGGASQMQSFRGMFSVRPQAGVPTLVATGVPEQIGDAGAASWTITVTAGASLTVAFSTGATQSQAQATAHVEFTEIRTT